MDSLPLACQQNGGAACNRTRGRLQRPMGSQGTFVERDRRHYPLRYTQQKGKGIALRLGLKSLENWQELINFAREFSDAKILV
jgi:hypothetical protein